jgi:hypothetical protein
MANEFESQDLQIRSLSGGQNDTMPPSEIADDECVLARNVEFFYSALGERRLGCGPLDLTSSGLTTETVPVHFTEWPISNEVLNQQIFAITATPTVSYKVAVRTNMIWAAVAGGSIKDAIITTVPAIYQIVSQALGKRLFVAYKSAVDRMHVWDGTLLRRTGFTQPNPPTAAETGAAGTYAGVRYFRVRMIQRDGAGDVLRQSEPSTEITVTPSGTKTGTVITQPAVLPGEGETDWIVEASKDAALWYQIATVAIGTTTYTDTRDYALGYSALGPVSPEIGDYDNIPAARFLAIDGDRLIFGGHFTDQDLMSQVGWTPVQNDPGFGNSERLPLDVDNTKVLDNYVGGPLTGLSSSDFGTWYAFKFSRTYRATRTGDVNNAYEITCLSSSRGAIEGSIFRGYTEDGSSCIYFLDPLMGPSRVGSFGIQSINGLRDTWGRVNLQASALVAHGCFYPYKQQAHWWVAVDGNDRPNFKIVNQISELRQIDGDAVGRGWSTWDGVITQATCSAIITEIVSIAGVTSVSERPFIGIPNPNFIQRCDSESTDAGTAYVATIRTKPYILAGQLNLWGGMLASLMAAANATASVVVKLIRDFGKETNQVTTTLAVDPTGPGTETMVFKKLDDLRMSEAKSIQVEFTDP